MWWSVVPTKKMFSFKVNCLLPLLFSQAMSQKSLGNKIFAVMQWWVGLIANCFCQEFVEDFQYDAVRAC